MDAAAARSRRTSMAMRAELLDPMTDRKLAERVAEFEALRQRAKTAASTLTGSEQILRAAEAEDRAAAAAAVVGGRSASDLGTPAQDAARAKIRAADTEFTALSDAVEAAWAELWPAYRDAASAEETAARGVLADETAAVEAVLAEVEKALASWREAAQKVIYWRTARNENRTNWNPSGPIGLRGQYVERSSVDTSDVRRELDAVRNLLDPPMRHREVDITDDAQQAKPAPARVR